MSGTTPQLRIRLLGPVELLRADGSATAIGAAKRRSVLAALAIEVNRVVSADRLIDIAWDGAPPPTARAALQGHIAKLRKELGDGVDLVTRAPGYQLVAPRAAVDMTRFEDLVAAARNAPDADAVELLDAALALHRGPPLADVASDRLRREVVGRLDESMISAVHELAWRLHRIGRATEAIEPLREAVAMRPLREPLVELLVLSLHQAGRQAEALDVYHATRSRLADELGVAPGPALQAAFQRVLESTEDSPPAAVPAQLPAENAGFVGRGAELAELDRAGDGAIRVLTGPAGAGKTALALRWAHRAAAQFPDGALFADLRGFGEVDPVEPGTVLSAFLRGLGVPDARIPDDPDERGALYRSVLSGRRVLVVLDNARSATQVRPLLPGPGSAVLVTSRSRLDELAATAGAVRVPVPPLSRGAAVEVLRFALGTERVDADPEAAEELAELCERLPLALRIAGSRPAHRTVRSLVTAAADERYRLTALSLPDSGEGVRAALAASYHRLDPGTARLFRLLGEHPGDSVERSAAAALADTPLVETCARLEQLAAIHLLQETEHGRYRWSDLVRLYATEVAATETTAERDRAFSRLLDHYLHVTDRSLRFLGDCARWLAPPTEAPAVRTAQSALTWFRTEETTLHRVLERAVARQEHARACHLALSLARFHHRLGDRDARTELSRLGLGLARELGDARAQAAFSAILAEDLAS